MKILAITKLTIMRSLAFVCIGLVTLTSCNQNTHNSEMMHNNGGSYYWGMHMGWWYLVLLVVMVLLVLFFNSRKIK